MSTSQPIRLAILSGEGTVRRWAEIESIEVKSISSEEALADLPSDEIDVIVVDDSRPWGELIPRIRAGGISARVIIWSPSEDPSDIASAMEAGAAGVVDPGASTEELRRALQIVMAGGSYLPPLDRLIVLDGLNATRKEGSFNSPGLSARETEVLAMLAGGLSARQISTKLSLSERTINTHVANVYRKLGVSNRVEAVMLAMRMGIVSPRE